MSAKNSAVHPPQRSSFPKTFLAAAIALTAFAANSVFARKALGEGRIDPAAFTALRLFSGATILWLLIQGRAFKAKQGKPKNKVQQISPPSGGSWVSAVMLFAYATTFSFAYLSLKTGTGALILFGAVQITMILAALRAGARLKRAEWLGLLLAFSGFIVLVFPGLTAPSLSGFLLMSVAGISWGFYTLAGRGIKDALGATAGNFFRSLAFVALLALLFISKLSFSAQGVLLALLSGTLSSGLGYAIWYVAIRGMSATQAAVIQLSVPILAAFGGVIFISERISLRLSAASIMILGGIALVLLTQRRAARILRARS